MPRKRPFFTKEMAFELKKLREKAGLSQNELGARMGFPARNSGAYVSKLEHGRVTRPYLDTIIHYLRGCGVIPTTYFQLFNRIESVPVEWPAEAPRSFTTKSFKNTKGPEPGEFTTKAPGHQVEKKGEDVPNPKLTELILTGPTEKDKAQVVEKTREEMSRYERKVAYPRKGAPMPPAKQRPASQNMQRFMLLTKTIEKQVEHLMADTTEPFAVNHWYKSFSRHVLSVTRKKGLPEDLNPDVLVTGFSVEEREMIQKWGLKEEIAGDVRALTIVLYAKLKPTMDAEIGTASERK